MSDCQSWFGSARSKRVSGRGAFSTSGGRDSSNPSSCRIRRTVVSDTPSPSKRRNTSAMRRVPSAGLSCFARTTRARLASSTLGAALRGPVCLGVSAGSPPCRNARSHFAIADSLTPKMRATSAAGVLSSSTSRSTRSRNSGG